VEVVRFRADAVVFRRDAVARLRADVVAFFLVAVAFLRAEPSSCVRTSRPSSVSSSPFSASPYPSCGADAVRFRAELVAFLRDVPAFFRVPAAFFRAVLVAFFRAEPVFFRVPLDRALRADLTGRLAPEPSVSEALPLAEAAAWRAGGQSPRCARSPQGDRVAVVVADHRPTLEELSELRRVWA
jgi:hypothetical protein